MPSRPNLIFTAITVVVLGGLAAAYINVISGGGASVTAFADPDNAAMVAHGETLYVENCAECHGQNLEGQPNWQIKNADGILPAPPHDATGHTWHHADQLLFDITKRGGQAAAPKGFISGMPEFGEILSDDDILATLAYIKSRWPQEIRKRQAMMTRKMASQ